MLFLTGLELASKDLPDTASPALGLQAHALMQDVFGHGFWDCWLHLQAHFCLSYPLPCPEVYVPVLQWSCHQAPGRLVRSETVPWEVGRGMLLTAPLSFCFNLQERSKAQVERAGTEKGLRLHSPGFPFRNGNKIWLVRRIKPALRELVTGRGGKYERSWGRSSDHFQSPWEQSVSFFSCL